MVLGSSETVEGSPKPFFKQFTQTTTTAEDSKAEAMTSSVGNVADSTGTCSRRLAVTSSHSEERVRPLVVAMKAAQCHHHCLYASINVYAITACTIYKPLKLLISRFL